MSHPDGSPYTQAERRAIVEEARRTAQKLLEKLELLAYLDGVGNAAVARERTQGDGRYSGGTGNG